MNARGMTEGARKANAALDSVRKKAKSTTTGIRGLDDQMEKSGKTASRMKMALGGLFAGFTAVVVIRSAINTFKEFELTMQTVRGVTGATASEFERLSKTARDLGATTRFSAKEAGEGLLFLARAGFTVDEAIAAIPSTLDLAAAGMLDLGRAGDIVSNVLAQFGMEAIETTRVADAMVKSANIANTTVEQLADAMKFVGPIAGAMGISLEEAASAVGVLSNAGIQASMAGTNLRGMLSNLLGPTSQATARLEELGIELRDLDPSINSISSILHTLKDAHLSAGDAVEIFGRRIASAALIMASGADEYDELLFKTEGATGTAKELADMMNDSVVGSLLSAKSAAEELMLGLGESGLMGSFRGLVDITTGVLRTLAGMGETVKENKFVVEALSNSVIALTASFTSMVVIGVAAWLLKTAMALHSLEFALFAVRYAIVTNPFTSWTIAISALIGTLVVLNSTFNTTTDEMQDVIDAGKDLEYSFDAAADASRRLRRARITGDMDEELRQSAVFVNQLQNSIDKLNKSKEGGMKAIPFSKEFAVDNTAQPGRGIPQREQDMLELADTLRKLDEEFKKVTKSETGFLHGLETDAIKKMYPQVDKLSDSTLYMVTQWASLPELIEALEGGMESFKQKTLELAKAHREAGEAIAKQEKAAQKLSEASGDLVRQQSEVSLMIKEGELGEEAVRRFRIMEKVKKDAKAAGLSPEDYDNLLDSMNAEISHLFMLEKQLESEINARESLSSAKDEEAKLRDKAVNTLDDVLGGLRQQNALLKVEEEVRGTLTAILQAQAIATAAKNGASADEIAELDLKLKEIIKLIIENDKLTQSEKDLATATAATGRALDESTRAAERAIEAKRNANNELKGLGTGTFGQQLDEREFTTNFKLNGGTDKELEKMALMAKARELAETSGDSSDLEGIGNQIDRIHEAEDALDAFNAKQEEGQRLARSMAQTMTGAMGDIISGSKTAEEALKGMAAAMIDMIIQAMILKPLQDALAGGMSGFMAPGSSTAGGPSLASARGNVFDSPIPFAAGGVITRPMMFPLAGGRSGIAGEAGPEAILPLQRDSSGRLGVGGSGESKNITIIQNFPGSDPEKFRRGRRMMAAEAKRAMG